ncbi:carbohydrate ABC transporter permease [Caldicellulosiruptoraceae bacterium PP1]
MLMRKKSLEDIIFDTVIYVSLIFVMLITLYPFLNLLAISFNDAVDSIRGGVYIFPRKFTTYNYRVILTDHNIYMAAFISILRTVIGTFLGLLTTLLIAYPLSHKDLLFRKQISAFFVFTMYFSGGLIPSYFLIKSLNLINSFWVYIIPNLFSAFNVIVLRSYIETLPTSIYESAKIDGAGDYRILFKIILPLTLPALATIALFIGVWQWNSWFDTFLYTSQRQEISTLQYELQKVLQAASKQMSQNADFSMGQSGGASNTITPNSIRATMAIVATVPILIVYPFLQRYFITGLTLGGVKG